MNSLLVKTVLLASSLAQTCVGFSTPAPTVSTLLKTHEDTITQLQQLAQEKFPEAADESSMFYLRYCLKEGTTDEERYSLLESNMQWRLNEGKEIVQSAKQAVEAAMASGSWDNEPVREMAPHAASVNKYITPTQCLTTTLRSGDLCYCIRAGQIDDVSLMSEVSLDEMTEFFLYCKEINAIVANMRSEATDRVVDVLTANDLKGVKLVGGDATFRKALSAASTKANELYPSLSGPTFLLNLPRLLGALVKLFTPLFPVEVRKRLKFEQGPLRNVQDLVEISGLSMGNAATREQFLDDIDRLLSK